MGYNRGRRTGTKGSAQSTSPSPNKAGSSLSDRFKALHERARTKKTGKPVASRTVSGERDVEMRGDGSRILVEKGGRRRAVQFRGKGAAMEVDSAAAAKKSGRRHGRAGTAMEIDTVGAKHTGRKGRQPRGQKTRLTPEGLDKDLDGYMMKDVKTAKGVLDNDLDAYMTTTAAQIGQQ